MKLCTIVCLLALLAGAGCDRNNSQEMLVRCRDASLAKASIDMNTADFKKLHDECAVFTEAQSRLCAYASEEERKNRNSYEATLNPEALAGFKEICSRGLFDTKNVVDGMEKAKDKLSSGLDSVKDGLSSAADAVAEKFGSDE